MGADALWSAGVDGSGETVAIVDEGFGGLDAAIAAGELPPRDQLETRSFDPANGLDGRNELEEPTQHGTRMAEIVHDVAPGARLVLVNYHTPEQFVVAAEWVAQQGIPIVSHSNSFLDGPFDGTGPAAQAVDRAALRGVLWVNSAGNFAQRHWEGGVSSDGTAVGFTVGEGGTALRMHLSWADRAATGALTIEQENPDGSWSPRFSGSPSGTQSSVVGPVQAFPGRYRALMRHTAGPPTTYTLFSQTVALDASPTGADSSIATPADAATALSVGAVPWTGDAVAPYSSRGPLDDGRPAPRLVAPTYVTANPAWPGTAGTSAAAAHAAGAAALLRADRRRTGLPADRDALFTTLVAQARDIDAPGSDLATGSGLLRLDTTPPRLDVRFTSGRRVVRLQARDDGTLDTTEIRIMGQAGQAMRRAQQRVRLPATVGSRSTIVVTATDMAGNTATRTLAVPAVAP